MNLNEIKVGMKNIEAFLYPNGNIWVPVAITEIMSNGLVCVRMILDDGTSSFISRYPRELRRKQKVPGILNDPRKIASLVAQTNIDETVSWEVGKNNVTKISVEAVPGNGAMVPWFVIQCSNGDFCRVNGACVYFINYRN